MAPRVKSPCFLCSDAPWRYRARSTSGSRAITSLGRFYGAPYLPGEEPIGLDDVEDAFHKMERGEVLRSVVTI